MLNVFKFQMYYGLISTPCNSTINIYMNTHVLIKLIKSIPSQIVSICILGENAFLTHEVSMFFQY
jgi:hypothetical protein